MATDLNPVRTRMKRTATDDAIHNEAKAKKLAAKHEANHPMPR